MNNSAKNGLSGLVQDGSNLLLSAYETVRPYAGPTLYTLGQPIKVLKPKGFLGSQPGSSLASWTFRKVPGTLTGTFGSTAGKFLARGFATNGLGAAIGRFVPVLGVITITYDFTFQIAIPMAEGNAAYREANNKSGNWISNLPH